MNKLPIRSVELSSAILRNVLRPSHALMLFLFLTLAVKAEEARFFRIMGPGATAIMEVTPDGYVTWTNELTNVTCTVQTTRVFPEATNWVDHVQVPVSNHVVAQRLFDLNPPVGTVLVPAGSFTMGNSMDSTEGSGNELPLHAVYVSAFYMDEHEVTKALWDEVYNWALTHGYSFEFGAQGKANNHPAQSMTWYDAVKWCNARSEKEGREAAYYTNAARTMVYRDGQVNVQDDWVKWNAGYRLPTEAEWEKAARGGAGGRRFPWSDANTISHSRANYYSYWSGGMPHHPYDVNVTSGYHPTFAVGGYPNTSPAGFFAANGYELYDLAGNVREWCWDWLSGSYYSSSPGVNPRGPVSGSSRVLRGGSWDAHAYGARCAARLGTTPGDRKHFIGFRCVWVGESVP